MSGQFFLSLPPLSAFLFSSALRVPSVVSKQTIVQTIKYLGELLKNLLVHSTLPYTVSTSSLRNRTLCRCRVELVTYTPHPENGLNAKQQNS